MFSYLRRLIPRRIKKVFHKPNLSFCQYCGWLRLAETAETGRNADARLPRELPAASLAKVVLTLRVMVSRTILTRSVRTTFHYFFPRFGSGASDGGTGWPSTVFGSISSTRMPSGSKRLSWRLRFLPVRASIGLP